MSDHQHPPQWILDLHTSLGRIQAAISGNLEAARREAELTRESLRQELAWLQAYVDQRITDLSTEVFARFTRTEEALARAGRQGPAETGAPAMRLRSAWRLAAGLARLPWRDILLVVAAMLAVLGHLLPAQINQALRSLLTRMIAPTG